MPSGGRRIGAGRPPKPTELKILEGNRGNRPLNQHEPKPAPGMPERPSWLTAEAKDEWDKIAPILEKLGLLTEVDGAALAGYCMAYARWREAEEYIAKHGMVYTTPTGHTKQVPHVAIAQKYLVILSGFLGRFGLSPADRVGLVGTKSPDPSSGIGRFLSR